MSNNALIPLGEISKPATVLIEKVSEAVGGIFRPRQVIRVARAEAEADRIRAEADIEITELHRRAFRRFLNEEAAKQGNIESITQRAIPLLNENSSPDEMDNDWIVNFFDKSRIVSKDDMKTLWAKILAREANVPGTFSRKTVNLMADLDSPDAELFTHLCGFGWMIGNVVPLVFDPQAEIYNRSFINFNSLSHLDSLGLVQFGSIATFVRFIVPSKAIISYYGRPVEITLPEKAKGKLQVGHVLLTKAGQEIASVCGSRPVEGFFEYVYGKWESKGLISPTKPPAEPKPAG